MNQSCKVCGEPAAGFHFGAFTCEGCKSFFGRTYNNLSSIQECKNNGQCVIDKKNRTSCKACRLRKCLMVGMSKSGSRYGRRSNWFKIHCLLQEQANLKSPLPPSVFEGAFGPSVMGGAPPTSNTPTSKDCHPDHHHHHQHHHHQHHQDGTKSPSAGSHESFASEASADSTEKASNNSAFGSTTTNSASPLSPTYDPAAAIHHHNNNNHHHHHNHQRDFFLRPPSLSPAVSPVFSPSLFHHNHHHHHNHNQQRFFFPYAAAAASGYAWAKLHQLLPKTQSSAASEVGGLLEGQALLFGHAFERFKGQPEQEKPMDLSTRGGGHLGNMAAAAAAAAAADVDAEDTCLSSNDDSEDDDQGIREADDCPLDKEVAPLDLTKPHSV